MRSNLKMWRRCTIEGCFNPTKHNSLCWHCLVQLSSFLALMGKPIYHYYADRSVLVRAAKESAGCLGHD